MVDPLRRKDFTYGVVVTPLDEALWLSLCTVIRAIFTLSIRCTTQPGAMEALRP
jgi:hypothetical protein